MVKFSDLLDDFRALVDTVSMQASLEEEGPSKDKALIALIKEQPQAETIIRRWESAARMRQWISEKKLTLVSKMEKRVTAELIKKKAEDKKKEEEKADEEKKK
jgi:hypothetical protein